MRVYLQPLWTSLVTAVMGGGCRSTVSKVVGGGSSGRANVTRVAAVALAVAWHGGGVRATLVTAAAADGGSIGRNIAPGASAGGAAIALTARRTGRAPAGGGPGGGGPMGVAPVHSKCCSWSSRSAMRARPHCSRVTRETMVRCP